MRRQRISTKTQRESVWPHDQGTDRWHLRMHHHFTRATTPVAAMKEPLMNIRKIAISKINRAPYNPRKKLEKADPEYQKLLRSINEFGLVEPLIWNKRTGNLVGGHQRLTVLVDEGATEVDVSVVDL